MLSHVLHLSFAQNDWKQRRFSLKLSEVYDMRAAHDFMNKITYSKHSRFEFIALQSTLSNLEVHFWHRFLHSY